MMLCVAMVTCFSSLFSYMHDDYSYIKTQRFFIYIVLLQLF